MGRNSGGSNNYAKGSSTPIAVNSNGHKLTQKQVGKMLNTATSTGGMKHRDMEKQINRAISRYEKVMGVRERSVKLADISGAYGVTYIGPNGSKGYILVVVSLTHQNASSRLLTKSLTTTTDLRTLPTVQHSTPLHTNWHTLHGQARISRQNTRLLERKSQAFTSLGAKTRRKRAMAHTARQA